MDTQTRTYFRQRVAASSGFAIRGDAVTAVLATIIGWFVLDRDSAIENAISAIVVGLGAGILYQIGAWVWRFVWVAPKRMYFDGLAEIARLTGERATALAQVEAKRESAAGRLRIGSKLTELLASGKVLHREILESDDSTSPEDLEKRLCDYRQSVVDFISAEISSSKAAYIDDVPNTFIAVDYTGLKSASAREAKTRQLQRLEHRLKKLAQLMSEY